MEGHWKKEFNYDYLGAYSLPDGKDVTLTISSLDKKVVIGSGNKKSECLIASFVEKESWVKPMVLNRTNCKVITKLYKTPFVENWIGKKIKITVKMVSAFGEEVDALRIVNEIPSDVVIKPTVEVGSPQWNGILDGISKGFTIEQVKTKYELTDIQIKLLNKK